MPKDECIGWCVVIHEPIDMDAVCQRQDILYLIAQEELGTKLGNYHIQAYVLWRWPVNITYVRTIFGKHAYGVKARGSMAENKRYCSDIEKRKEDGKTWEYTRPPTLRNCTCECYWGEPGSGKSWRAFHENPLAYRHGIFYFFTKGNFIWWDGYQGQDTCVWDDFDPSVVSYQTFNSWIDIYPVLVQTKGGMTDCAVEKWVFTSNTPPDEWYVNAGKGHAGMMRRFTIIEEYTKPWNQ